MSWLDETIDTSGVNPDQLDRGSCRTPGKYHVEVIDVKTDENKKSGGTDLRFDFQILAGTAKSEVGNIFYHRERDPQGNENRVFFMSRLAVQFGVTTKEEIKAGLNARAFFEAKGRQYVIEIVETPDKSDANKKYLNLGRVWDVADEAVSEVPKDVEAIEVAGLAFRVVDVPTPAPAASGSATPAAPPVAASTAAFDDL